MSNLDLKLSADERTQAFQEHEKGLLTCLAGPGTGKTYSLLKRVASLLERGESAEALCYLTFIRTIADAFTHDYVEELGQAAYEAAKPRISTLHSFACRLLRNQGFRIGYDGDLYFLNAADRNSDAASTLLGDLLVAAAQPTYGTVAKMRPGMESIKTAWQDRESLNALDDPLRAIADVALDLFKAYRTMDWDLAVNLAAELLGDERVSPSWLQSIEHYLVDEYQDFNRAEQSFIQLLSERADSVVVVGDDDQSLYSARGGSPEGMRSLYADSTADTVSLVNNYRCKSSIVKAANTFQTTVSEAPRSMVAMKDGGKILCRSFKSSKAEVEYLAKLLTKCVERTPEDAAAKEGTICLFPTHKALNSYYAALCDVVPVVRRSAPVSPRRELLARILQLARRPGQRFLQRLLMNEFSELKPRHKKMVLRLVMDRDISPYEALEVLSGEGQLKGAALAAAADFRALCEAAQSSDHLALLPLAASLTGIDAAQLAEPIQRFVASTDDFDDEETVSRICDEVIPESALPSESPNQVLFLTMHGSKGLTRKYVFMPGLERAWLPGEAEDEDLKEKRRLFYVALTRATDAVVITYPYNRAPGDPLNYEAEGRKEGSPFVEEAGLSFSYHE